MRRGPGGGLFVAEPGVEAVTEAVALQIDRLGIGPEHLREVRAAVELVVLDLVMARLDDAGVARLEAALSGSPPPRKPRPPAHRLHPVVMIPGSQLMTSKTSVRSRLAGCFHKARAPRAHKRRE